MCRAPVRTPNTGDRDYLVLAEAECDHERHPIAGQL
jgi:hypothetical protein